MKKQYVWLFILSISLILLMPFTAIARQHWMAESIVQSSLEIPSIVAETTDRKKPEENHQQKPFDEMVKDSEKIEGLFTLYRNEKKKTIYLEIKPEQLNKNFLCAMTLATGIGEAGIFSGMPVGELLFQFRRLQDNVQFVIPNVNFRARPGDAIQRSLDRAFSDSVLYSLKIESIHPERETLLVDLSKLMLTTGDLSGVSSLLGYVLGVPYTIDLEKSYFNDADAFPLNVEIESVYGFSNIGGETAYIPSLPDDRAFNLAIHYSLSALPVNTGYRSRLADERLGYFLTAYKDFSNDDRRDPFVRYINRWHLEKQDPTAPLSRPKKPIVFWIDNGVPLEYREAVRDGILMWNRAFEKAGFIEAIEARQMPDNPDWKPADVRYNTILWSTTFESWFSGIGPSRVNPITGQILDADILIDANIIRLMKNEYKTFVGQQERGFANDSGSGGRPDLCARTLEQRYLRGVKLPEGTLATTPQPQRLPGNSVLSRALTNSDLCYGLEFNRQFEMGAISLSLLDNVLPSSEEMEEYVKQYVSFLVAHEVGHTLGLRHNFHGSTLLAPEELNNREITRTKGMVSSVMDYVAVNLAPPGVEQGDYFPTTVGPYDEWAIEYGYKPIKAINSSGELRELREIARRAGEPELSFATDEDWFAGLDPAANLFDLSSDMLGYSQWQLENARAIWARLNERFPASGESYSEMREMFDTVFFYYFSQALNATLYVGGQSFNRHYAGDRNGRLPFEPIPVEEQRQALKIVSKYVFAEDAFEFSPQLLNQLAPSRWSHWGSFPIIFPLEYPIGDRLFLLQRIVLRSLLSPPRLTRLRDMELKVDSGDEALLLPELFDTLQESIWTEVADKEADLEDISSLRRSLQREYADVLTSIVLREYRVPEDAHTLAWFHLRQLRTDIDTTLRKRRRDLDTLTMAHFAQTRDRIDKVLNAPLQSKSGTEPSKRKK